MNELQTERTSLDCAVLLCAAWEVAAKLPRSPLMDWMLKEMEVRLDDFT